MYRITRAIDEARSRFFYNRPLYVPGYVYAPWKRLAITILVLSILLVPIIAHLFFHNPNAIPGLFTLLSFLSLATLLWGLIAPSHLSSKIMPASKEMSRKSVVIIFGVLSLLFLIMIGVTAPVSAGTTPTTRIVTETKAVPYSTATQYDSSLPKGQTQLVKDGIDGIETYDYIVTLSNGKESDRTLKSKSVTTEPVAQIVAVGTHVAPTASPQTTNTESSGYTNVDGNHINSPSSDPAGASAQCTDGTYSYSAHRQGTCSHHGGVARWL